MGWSVCPHDDNGFCVLLKGDYRPASRGCVLFRSVSRDTLVGRTGETPDDQETHDNPERDLDTKGSTEKEEVGPC